MGLAAFAATWLLLAPASDELPSPVAVVRRQAAGDDQVERLAVELLRSENLRRLMREAELDRDGSSTRNSGLAEWARSNLRVEFAGTDRAGKQIVSVRWAGEPGAKGAARLVNSLARQLADHPSTTDERSLQRQLDQAHADAIAAERALTHARRQFDEALAAAPVDPQYPAAPPPASVRTPTTAPESSEHAAWFLARQQLAELEQRRETLAERLMPEHPEMRSLDEKIDVLRSSLNNQPTPAPAVADSMPETVTDDVAQAGPVPSPELERVKQLGRKVLAAQERYNAALSVERAYWQRFAQAPGGTLAEIESAVETTQLAGHLLRWRRWLVSLIVAIAFAGLTLAIWPVGRQTFTSVEEVRAGTRLPVVVVDRLMLN